MVFEVVVDDSLAYLTHITDKDCLIGPIRTKYNVL